MKKDKIVVMYQIVSPKGDMVLKPYWDRRSAEYMVEKYFLGHMVIEVETIRGVLISY
jgi:hypothetical protein